MFCLVDIIVGFNSNQRIERFGEFGSSVGTNRPSPRPS